MKSSGRPSGTGRTTAALLVSVDNRLCHLYGICEQEAPDVFELGVDGRLRYSTRPNPENADATQQAARLCPMQAITLTGEGS
ncbi:ferredoxin [Salinibacterium sp.]|uniref:ferredoxin n=1 Tax=Salinibacterium sp. TaxID=1915057 RepID=UPI0037C55487